MSDFEDRVRRGLAAGAEQAPGASGLAAAARGRARRRRRRLAGAVAAVAVVAVAVPVGVLMLRDGDGSAPSGGRGVDPAAPASTLGQGPEVGCGGDATWPVAVMDGGLADEVDDARVRDALARLLDDAPMDAPPVLQEAGAASVDYTVLSVTGEELVVGVGPWSSEEGPGAGAMSIGLERDDTGRWEAGGWGDCQLAVVIPAGRGQVEVTAPPGGVDPATTAPTVLVNERDCTSGRDPRPFLGQPTVVESGDEVLVTLTSQALREDASCIGNPSVPLELSLAEPLGDRRLLDAGVWPYRELEVATPPPAADLCPDGVFANSDFALDPDPGGALVVCRMEWSAQAESGGSYLLAQERALTEEESDLVRLAVAEAPELPRSGFRRCDRGPREFYLVLTADGQQVPFWVNHGVCGETSVYTSPTGDGVVFREVTPTLLDALGSPYDLLR
ncbi:hypothetical protein [Nocardioides nanhaiensis]|uniref:Uncharacterized protein n=1 Tax=Nocardioides nanhaiensis TaxID=1476871 RepID=A0ABP8VZ61_9ACTN